MLYVLFLVIGIAIGWFGRGALRVQPGAVAPSIRFLLLYDGTSFRFGPASLVVPGKNMPAIELTSLGHTVPLASVVEFATGGYTLYMLGVNRLDLIEQDALRAARETVDMSALFTGGGGSGKFLHILAVAVPVLVSVAIYFSVSGMASSEAAVAQSIGAVKAVVVDKPLICRSQ